MTSTDIPQPARQRATRLSHVLDPRGPARIPVLVAYAGLVPFVALAAIVALGGGTAGKAASAAALKAYAAVALAFLGGIRWGMAMRVDTSRRGATLMATSVLPAIVGFAALTLPLAAGLGLLAAAHAGLGAWDVWSAERGGAPSWYGRLRLKATLVATGALAAGIFVLGF